LNKELIKILNKTNNIDVQGFIYYFLNQQLFFREKENKKTKKLKDLCKVILKQNDWDLEAIKLHSGKVDKVGIAECNMEDLEVFLNKNKIYKIKDIKKFLIKMIQKSIDNMLEVFVSLNEKMLEEIKELIYLKKLLQVL
jgi:hypothetical protein